MSFLAHLFINQRKIVILKYNLGFYQNKDIAGKPRGRIDGSIIWLTIELTAHTDLLHQMMNAEQMVEGYIRFYKRDAMSKLYDVEFWDTYVYYYRVHQVLNSGEPAKIDIGLSCGVLRNNGVVIKKPWHVTDIDALENPDYEGGEKVETIIKQYLTDCDSNPIKDYCVGDRILLNIETENMHKKIISVKIDDKEHDFKRDDVLLENDTIKNLEITDDLMQIELEVVKEREFTAKMYFVAGAGNDSIGWNYTRRFRRIWTELGISNFKKLNVPSGSDFVASIVPINDMIYVNQYRSEPVDFKNPMEGQLATGELIKKAHRRVREAVINDTKDLEPEETQINLAGYSYGSVVMCQAAIQLVGENVKIDNLILIGSPVSKKSNLYKKLQSYESEGKICQIIRHDIKGDYLSNTDGFMDLIQGAKQNSVPSGKHFDLARPDDPATLEDETIQVEKEITKLGKLLIFKGVK